MPKIVFLILLNVCGNTSVNLKQKSSCFRAHSVGKHLKWLFSKFGRLL